MGVHWRPPAPFRHLLSVFLLIRIDQRRLKEWGDLFASVCDVPHQLGVGFAAPCRQPDDEADVAVAPLSLHASLELMTQLRVEQLVLQVSSNLTIFSDSSQHL